jgi:hypothetical protein
VINTNKIYECIILITSNLIRFELCSILFFPSSNKRNELTVIYHISKLLDSIMVKLSSLKHKNLSYYFSGLCIAYFALVLHILISTWIKNFVAVSRFYKRWYGNSIGNNLCKNMITNQKGVEWLPIIMWFCPPGDVGCLLWFPLWFRLLSLGMDLGSAGEDLSQFSGCAVFLLTVVPCSRFG